MIASKEISALFQLIDDPDEEVFDTVTDRIISIGKPIIPSLENLYVTTSNSSVQERIELIIHKLHFQQLTIEFEEWKKGPRGLLQGTLLFCKYSQPDLTTLSSVQEIEKIRRNIWLELNSYLTPFEQVNIVTAILYGYYNLRGNENNYLVPEEFLLNKVLENKTGNSISNALLFLILCEMLDIRVKMLAIPRQFILGCFEQPSFFEEDMESEEPSILFYIDPLNGHLYSEKDIQQYFKRISVPPTPFYFKPQKNHHVIQQLMEEYSKCFSDKTELQKRNDLRFLSALLD